MDVQVENCHYSFKKYMDNERWMSYYHQLQIVLLRRPSRVLVIGKGDNIIPLLIKNAGIEVKTIDLDESLKPDFVCSITEIDTVIKEKFDLILCCQVLEHIPFENVESTLIKLKHISSEIIVSLPEKSFRMSFSLKLPKIKCIFFNIVIPIFFVNHKWDGQHYWELGTRERYKEKFIDVAKNILIVDNVYRLKTNPYHTFFILRNPVRV